MQFSDFAREHRIPTIEGGSHRHVTQGWIGADCPICSPRSQKFRLGWNKTAKGFSCWICGRLDIYTVLSHLTDLSGRALTQAVNALRGERGRHKPAASVHSGRLKLPSGVSPLLNAHKRYLTQRGLNPEKIASQWGVQGLDPACGRLSWRLFIPIHYKGVVVSWTTRSISANATLRYISPCPEHESVSLRTLLFGEDHCRHAIIIHEGPLDVFTTGVGAVGTLGLNYSRSQFMKMLRFPIRVICFDAEPVAQKRARRLLNDLSGMSGETYNVVLDSGKDTNSADPAEVEDLRKRFLY